MLPSCFSNFVFAFPPFSVYLSRPDKETNWAWFRIEIDSDWGERVWRRERVRDDETKRVIENEENEKGNRKKLRYLSSHVVKQFSYLSSSISSHFVWEVQTLHSFSCHFSVWFRVHSPPFRLLPSPSSSNSPVPSPSLSIPLPSNPYSGDGSRFVQTVCSLSIFSSFPCPAHTMPNIAPPFSW